jgi:hypothetical protein
MVIESRRGTSHGFDDLADALFIGKITNIGESTTDEEGYRTDKATGEKVPYIYYVRNVEVEFTYSFIRARDGTIIGPITKKGRAGDTNESRGSLTSVEELAKKVINSLMGSLHQDIAPYTITVSRTLAKDPLKALKPDMEAALAQVKAGNYLVARDAYIAIYEAHKSVAAAENASILFEALGETRAGADFMERVVAQTGNPRARNVLARLNMELREMAGAVEFKEAKSGLEKVAGTAVGEVRKHVSGDARVLIINNSAAENALVNSVIDNMTSALLEGGVTVVDRQSTAMIQAEQEFQMSGHVSDSDIVSVGNMAGANKVVIVSVTGTGAMRRLQVRVLDVETGTVLMQSDAGGRWSL